jgi:Icc-related predicted phosphoesterase
LIGDFKLGSPDTNVFLMLGNDDCAVNLDVLGEHPDLYHEIHGKRFRVDDAHEIVGYSFVPITPFGIKDFEKFDLSSVPEAIRKEYEQRKKSGYRFDGIRSVNSPSLGWQAHSFSQSQESNDSIQRDLESATFTARPESTVYVFHTPPNNTALDIIQDGEHVGSFAVRGFIEKYQPKLTLHGHIHETVDMSGRFIEQIGNSTMLSAGNHNYDSKVAVVEFDLYNPTSAQRKKLPCGKVGKMFNRLLGK